MGRVWLGTAQDGGTDDGRGPLDATTTVTRSPIRRPTRQHHQRAARQGSPRIRWPRWLGGA